MKMSAIKKLCVSADKFMIYECGGGQWIGTEEACFRVEGVRLTEEAIPAIFDLSEKKMEKLDIEVMQLEESELLPMEDWEAGEYMEDQGLSMSWGGSSYIFLEAKNKIYAMDMAHMNCAVGAGNYRRYALVENAQGAPLIIICDGMLTAGIVKPVGARDMAEMQKKMRALGMIPSGMQMEEREETDAE